MTEPVPMNLYFPGNFYETEAGDLLMEAFDGDNKILVLPLSESITVEGAMILADRIRERFSGCFLEDAPPTGPGCRVPGMKAA